MLKIDWTVMWKFFHYQFFWVYLAFGFLIRLVFAIRLSQPGSTRRAFYVVTSSSVTALLSTWFPIFPVICGAILVNAAGHAAIESILIAAPIVAISLGMETVLVDAMLFRLLLRESVKERFRALLTINVTNATIALALGLAWAFHHKPRVIDIP